MDRRKKINRKNTETVIQLAQLWLKDKKVEIHAAENKEEIRQVFNAIVISINELLKNDYDVSIKNLGKFTVVKKNRYVNIKTNEIIDKEKRYVKFSYTKNNKLND